MNVFFKILGFVILSIIGLFLWSLGFIKFDQSWSTIFIWIVIIWSVYKNSEKIEHLTVKVEELKNFSEFKISSLEESKTSNYRKLFELSEEIRTLTEDRHSLSEEVIKLRDEVNGLWENRDTLKEEVDDLLENRGTLKEDIDSLDKETLRVVRSIDDRIDNIEWDISKLKTATEKSGEIIDGFSKRIFSLERRNFKARPIIR